MKVEKDKPVQVVIDDPGREVLLRSLVVYVRPADLPGRCVAVRGRTMYREGTRLVPDEPDVLASVFPSLRAAREAMPAGMQSMGRSRDDDQTIAEVWL